MSQKCSNILHVNMSISIDITTLISFRSSISYVVKYLQDCSYHS